MGRLLRQVQMDHRHIRRPPNLSHTLLPHLPRRHVLRVQILRAAPQGTRRERPESHQTPQAEERIQGRSCLHRTQALDRRGDEERRLQESSPLRGRPGRVPQHPRDQQGEDDR